MPVFCSIILPNSYPDIWKTSYVKPLHKTGLKIDIQNYRPISHLPVLSLVFEKILHSFIDYKIKDKLTTRQFGFQSRKSSIIQLLDFLETVLSSNSSNLYAVYLDYAKAFDKVPFNDLLNQLWKFGFDESFLELFATYLFNRFQTVLRKSSNSRPLSVLSGVPQGSVSADLIRLMNWNISNGVLVNASTTKCICFKVNVNVTFEDIPIDDVIAHSDLGVISSPTLKWDPHFSQNTQKQPSLSSFQTDYPVEYTLTY